MKNKKSKKLDKNPAKAYTTGTPKNSTIAEAKKPIIKNKIEKTKVVLT